jgi:dihydroxyacetone kinase-like protein
MSWLTYIKRQTPGATFEEIAMPLVNELYVLYRQTALRCKRFRLDVVRNYIGNYCTSLDMAGASLTLLKFDEDTEDLLAAPADIAVRVF